MNEQERYWAEQQAMNEHNARLESERQRAETARIAQGQYEVWKLAAQDAWSKR